MKKEAFTLAEVLITLAIIGVIASMTIPSLIGSTNNAEIVAKVKKYQSVFSQAVLKAEVDNNCIGDLSACGAFSAAGEVPTAPWNFLKPYLNITKDCGTATGCFNPGVSYKWLNYAISGTSYVSDNEPKFAHAILADGSFIFLYKSPNANCANNASISTITTGPMYNSMCGSFDVDVNGAKGPNQQGRDVFSYVITKSGVYPAGMDGTIFAGCNPASNDTTASDNGAAGIGYCTAKVLQDGAVNY